MSFENWRTLYLLRLKRGHSTLDEALSDVLQDYRDRAGREE